MRCALRTVWHLSSRQVPRAIQLAMEAATMNPPHHGDAHIHKEQET